MGQTNPKDSSRVRGDARMRREQRQREAEERQELCGLLSAEDRMARLEARRGNSERERAKLMKVIEQRRHVGTKAGKKSAA
jgi:hypothetical protein